MAAAQKAALDQPLTTMLNHRLESIEGVEQKAKREFLGELAMSDLPSCLPSSTESTVASKPVLTSNALNASARQGSISLSRRVLLAGEGADEAGPEQLFPAVELDDWREGLFQLSWQQHGGSGLGMTRSEALDLQLDERQWLRERIEQQRERESKQLEQANEAPEVRHAEQHGARVRVHRA